MIIKQLLSVKRFGYTYGIYGRRHTLSQIGYLQAYKDTDSVFMYKIRLFFSPFLSSYFSFFLFFLPMETMSTTPWNTGFLWPLWQPLRTFLHKSNPRAQCHLISNEFSVPHQINRVSSESRGLLITGGYVSVSENTYRDNQVLVLQCPRHSSSFPLKVATFIFYKTHEVTSSPCL